MMIESTDADLHDQAFVLFFVGCVEEAIEQCQRETAASTDGVSVLIALGRRRVVVQNLGRPRPLESLLISETCRSQPGYRRYISGLSKPLR